MKFDNFDPSHYTEKMKSKKKVNMNLETQTKIKSIDERLLHMSRYL
jgi:hypothetical protein